MGDGIGREGTVEVRTRKAKSVDTPWNQEVLERMEAKKALAELAREHIGEGNTMARSDDGNLEFFECRFCPWSRTKFDTNPLCPNVENAVQRCLAAGCTLAEIEMVWREASLKGET